MSIERDILKSFIHYFNVQICCIQRYCILYYYFHKDEYKKFNPSKKSCVKKKVKPEKNSFNIELISTPTHMIV